MTAGGAFVTSSVAFAKVTGYSPTTFGVFADAALTTPVYFTGTYSAGGRAYWVNESYPIAAGASQAFAFSTPVGPAGWYEFASAPGVQQTVIGVTSY